MIDIFEAHQAKVSPRVVVRHYPARHTFPLRYREYTYAYQGHIQQYHMKRVFREFYAMASPCLMSSLRMSLPSDVISIVSGYCDIVPWHMPSTWPYMPSTTQYVNDEYHLHMQYVDHVN